MSHQTGIRGNEDLVQFFGKCRDGHYRAFRVSIINEELALNGFAYTRSDWEKDFDELVPFLVEENQPSYIFFRFDTKNSLGYEWLLIMWNPDSAPVREKMLYASTKATLKNQFGSGQIKEELFATISSDTTLQGYYQHKRCAAAPAPLTAGEEERALIKQIETNANIGVDTKHQTLTGVVFPMSDEALAALIKFKSKVHNYVQYSIDMEKELINLEIASSITLDELPAKVPNNHGRYHLFRFPHTHEGDFLESIVFIYSMPGYACPIRERMLYSSCKGPITDIIENRIAIPIDKKIEVEQGSELDEEFFMDELHPKKNLYQPKFEKPKGPPNRGARRLLKKADEQ